MFLFMQKIGRLEVVIEKHDTTLEVWAKLERPSPSEIIIDFGKFSLMACWGVRKHSTRTAKLVKSMVIILGLAGAGGAIVHAGDIWQVLFRGAAGPQ